MASLRYKLWILIVAPLGVAPLARGAGYDGKLTVIVNDEATGQPISARMELRNGRGRPVRIKAEGAIFRDDYVVFDGQIDLELPQGSYRFFLEAGPEYHTREGHFTIERHAEDSTTVTLKRHVNMAEQGWWSGDLDVRHRREDLPFLMRAAGVSLAAESVGENLRGKCREIQNASDGLTGPKTWLDLRRGGGLLLVAHDDAELPDKDFCQLAANGPSVSALQSAVEAGADAVALSAEAWDLPLWVAADKLTSVQVMNRFTLAGAAADKGSRPREKVFLSRQTGAGRANEAIYHHLLNCGLRIPPAAGSGSGAEKSPLGTNRVYVHCGDEYTQENWLEGLRAGRVVVTNGPLLRTSVEGQPPGHVFHIDQGESREFQIALSLSFYEKAPVEYLEIVKNGRAEHAIRLDELAKSSGQLPSISFDGSGWFLVRAVSSNSQTYQYASTGPYFVEAAYQPRISRSSVEYFLKWLDDAADQFAGNDAVLAEIAAARPFWEDLRERANAD